MVDPGPAKDPEMCDMHVSYIRRHRTCQVPLHFFLHTLNNLWITKDTNTMQMLSEIVVLGCLEGIVRIQSVMQSFFPLTSTLHLPMIVFGSRGSAT